MVHFHQQTRNQVTVWKNSKSINWDEFSWKRDQKVLNASKKKFWEKFLNFNLRYLLVFVRPTREVFTRMETSPLSSKGFKFWTMPGTHGHEALRVLSVPHLMWHGSSVYNGHLRGQLTLVPVAELLVGELSLPVFND